MKKKAATSKQRVNKSAVALAEYKASAVAYFNSIRSRRSVEHSTTPSIVTSEGKTGPASILISELTSIVKTANKLNKLVVLGSNGANLVVLLEDKVPAPDYALFC
jgi:hypothetical protein